MIKFNGKLFAQLCSFFLLLFAFELQRISDLNAAQIGRFKLDFTINLNCVVRPVVARIIIICMYLVECGRKRIKNECVRRHSARF